MTRWEPNAHGRLLLAAVELYGERGFEQTTVAEIAQRAGVTERTFFRYFADKREVLFDGASALLALMVDAAAAAPPDVGALDAVASALQASAEHLGGDREFSRQRQRLIAANPELLERELAKLSALTESLTVVLRDRGVAEPAASLAAGAGVAVFRLGFERWVVDLEGEPPRELAEHFTLLLAELRAVTAAG